MSFLLKNLFGPFLGLFRLFGFAFNTFVEVVRRVLETFGFVSPQANDVAAKEAEDAVARNAAPFIANRRTVTWLPETKSRAIADWCQWKTGNRPGAEPSLEGLSLKEKLKLRAADEKTLTVLPLRTMSEIEAWFQSPKKALAPLTPKQLAFRKAQFERDKAEAAPVVNRWMAVAAGADDIMEADDLISQIEADLSYPPRGFAAA